MRQYTFNYLSPLTYRYGGKVMRHLWSLECERIVWRYIWRAIAKAEAEVGLIPDEALKAILTVYPINLDRSMELELKTHHDLIAELSVYREQCFIGGSYLHLGATSADIKDNADAMRIKQGLTYIIRDLMSLLDIFERQIEAYATTVVMGFTHLQPAVPTTVGYRLAQYAQDLRSDLAELTQVRDSIRGKGIKGAVGTSASFEVLLEGSGMTPEYLEALVMAELEISAFEITTQVYPRKQDWRVLNVLAGLGMSLYRFAFDFRLLQSPLDGTWTSKENVGQSGSSAMPIKSNPVDAEKINSLARYLAGLPRVAWDNAAHSLLERTLDDSANRRLMLPEAFIITDELVRIAVGLIQNLIVTDSDLSRYPTAGMESLLMILCKAGARRENMDNYLRQLYKELPPKNFKYDQLLREFITPEEIDAALDVAVYVGNVKDKTRKFTHGSDS